MPLTRFQQDVLSVIVANRSELEKIKARHLDPIEMKMEWIEMCDRAEEEMIRLADDQPDTPIGVAFVDAKGEPGWIGRDPTLRIHRLSLRGSWPDVRTDAAGA